ncbi:hypothetical protein ES703_19403 [subsurface metagenome]
MNIERQSNVGHRCLEIEVAGDIAPAGAVVGLHVPAVLLTVFQLAARYGVGGAI